MLLLDVMAYVSLSNFCLVFECRAAERVARQREENQIPVAVFKSVRAEEFEKLKVRLYFIQGSGCALSHSFNRN